MVAAFASAYTLICARRWTRRVPGNAAATTDRTYSVSLRCSELERHVRVGFSGGLSVASGCRTD